MTIVLSPLRIDTSKLDTNQGFFAKSLESPRMDFKADIRVRRPTSQQCPIKQLQSIVWFRYDLQLQVQSMFQQVTPQGALLGSQVCCRFRVAPQGVIKQPTRSSSHEQMQARGCMIMRWEVSSMKNPSFLDFSDCLSQIQ